MSPRKWVLLGFAITIVSVVLNTFVISWLSGKTADIDQEMSKIRASLTRQATELVQAEVKYDLARVLRYASMAIKDPENSRRGRQEAMEALRSYLRRNYAAVHDIPVIEVMRVENDEMVDDIEVMKKARSLGEQLAKTEDPKEIDRIEKELNAIDENAVAVPHTELGKKFVDVEKAAEADFTSDDPTDFLWELIPLLDSFQKEFTASVNAKQKRLEELAREKDRLDFWSKMASYGAISLQLLGLMFVLAKDLWDTRPET